MTASSPIAFGPIGLDDEETETYYTAPSRILPSGTFHLPAQVPTVLEIWLWDDGTPVLWNDDTYMESN